MPELRINIKFDPSGLRIPEFKAALDKAIAEGLRQTAKTLLRDCRPYVPMLTGKLRDSGAVQQLEDYAYSLVWDAANLKNGYVYAEKQYEQVLQHVDGKYAAEWVKRTLAANPGRYAFLASRFVTSQMRRLFEAQEK